MTFDINEFRAEIQKNGYLRPWEYSVTLNPPSGLNGAQFTNQSQEAPAGNMTGTISLRCTQARTPTAQLEWLDIPRYGIGLKQAAPFNAKIKNFHIAILCDKNGNLYNFFHSWLNYIFAYSPPANAQAGGVANQSRGTYMLNYSDNYTTSILLNMYKLTGETAMQFEFFRAFPVTMTEIILDWETAKSLVELNIVFDYREYSLVTSNMGVGTLNTSLTSPGPSTSIPSLTPLINA